MGRALSWARKIRKLARHKPRDRAEPRRASCSRFRADSVRMPRGRKLGGIIRMAIGTRARHFGNKSTSTGFTGRASQLWRVNAMSFKRSAVSAGSALLLTLFSAGPLLAQQQPPPAEPVEPVQPRDAGDFDWGLLGLLGLLGLAGLAGGRRPTPGPRT